MKIQTIRHTQEQGLVADVWLTPRSILPVSIPVDQCTLEALVEYALRDNEHDAIADAPAIVYTASASMPKEQTYQEFQALAEKYAPKPFVPKPNCEHKNEYATRGGMMCRDCHKTREAITDFEKRLVSKLTPRINGYVNYGMR